MTTVRQLATQCGVSETAIRKWCARNNVPKHNKTYELDEATESAILAYYHAEVSKHSCEHGYDGSKQSELDETIAKVAELENRVVDLVTEVTQLRAQNAELQTKVLEYADKFAQLADQAQKLQAMSAQARPKWRLPWRRRDDNNDQG